MIAVARGEIGYRADVGWFAVEMDAGEHYRIHLDGEGAYRAYGETLANPRIAGVYDADGELLPASADGDSGDGQNSRLGFMPDGSGTHYIAAAGAGGAVGTYRLMVVRTGMTDDYGADTETTGAVVPGGKIERPRHGIIERPGDRDWFAVELRAGRLYTIEVRSRRDEP